MSQEPTISSLKERPTTIRLSTEGKASFEVFKQENKIKSNTEAWEKILKQIRSSPTLETRPAIPGSCFKCDFKPHLRMIKGEPHIICILKTENKAPIIKDNILEIAQFCSQEPTHITMPTKEKYDSQIETLTSQLDRAEEDVPRLEAYGEALRKKLIEKDEEHNEDVTEIHRLADILHDRDKVIDKARKQLQPMQDLLTERDTLKSKVSDMENTLLERDKKIAILETDNIYKDELIKKLSESELLSENDALHLELNQKIKLNNEYTLEIQKLEALRKTDQQTLNDVISQTKKVFRDFNESVPAWMNPLPFILNVQKKIKDFEGYVQTITS